MAHYLRFIALVVLVSAVTPYPCYARQGGVAKSACAINVPVTPILPNGTLLIGLNADSFSIHVHGQQTAITEVRQAIAPTRIVLLLDASRSVNAEAWTIETSLARYFADVAPAATSVALVVINCRSPVLDFTTPREALQSRLEDLAATRPANTESGEDVYGGMAAGLHIFGTKSEFGDAMFALVGGADDRSAIGARQLEHEFIQRGVRLFGFILGQKSLYGVYRTIPHDDEIPFAPDTDEMGWLAVDTGGLLAVENTQMPQQTYHVTDARLIELQTTTHRFCTLMMAPYQVRFDISAASRLEDWSVDLDKEIKSKIPSSTVLFPHQLAPCAVPKSP